MTDDELLKEAKKIIMEAENPQLMVYNLKDWVDSVDRPANKEEAERIYMAYPRKVGKPAALKAIQSACRFFEPDYILRKTADFAEIAEKADEDRRQFIPYPSTFFNQWRFNDPPDEWRTQLGVQPVSPEKPGGLKRL